MWMKHETVLLYYSQKPFWIVVLLGADSDPNSDSDPETQAVHWLERLE